MSNATEKHNKVDDQDLKSEITALKNALNIDQQERLKIVEKINSGIANGIKNISTKNIKKIDQTHINNLWSGDNGDIGPAYDNNNNNNVINPDQVIKMVKHKLGCTPNDGGTYDADFDAEFIQKFGDRQKNSTAYQKACIGNGTYYGKKGTVCGPVDLIIGTRVLTALYEEDQAKVEPNKSVVDPKKEVVDPKKEVVDPKKEVVDPKKEVVDPKKEVVDPKKEVVDPKKEVVDPKKEVVDPKKEVVDPKKEVVDPKKEVVDPKKEVVDPKKEVVDPKKEVVDPKKEVVDPKKEVVDPKKEVVDPKKEVGTDPDFQNITNTYTKEVQKDTAKTDKALNRIDTYTNTLQAQIGIYQQASTEITVLKNTENVQVDEQGKIINTKDLEKEVVKQYNQAKNTQKDASKQIDKIIADNKKLDKQEAKITDNDISQTIDTYTKQTKTLLDTKVSSITQQSNKTKTQNTQKQADAQLSQAAHDQLYTATNDALIRDNQNIISKYTDAIQTLTTIKADANSKKEAIDKRITSLTKVKNQMDQAGTTYEGDTNSATELQSTISQLQKISNQIKSQTDQIDAQIVQYRGQISLEQKAEEFLKAQQEYINLKNAIRQVKQNLEKEKSQLQEKMSQKQAIDDGATKLASMDSGINRSNQVKNFPSMKADISSLTIMLDTSKPDNLTNELKKQQYITKKLAETLQTKQSSTPTQTELTMQEKQDIIDTIKPANYANESIDSNIIPIERRKYNTTLGAFKTYLGQKNEEYTNTETQINNLKQSIAAKEQQIQESAQKIEQSAQKINHYHVLEAGEIGKGAHLTHISDDGTYKADSKSVIDPIIYDQNFKLEPDERARTQTKEKLNLNTSSIADLQHKIDANQTIITEQTTIQNSADASITNTQKTEAKNKIQELTTKNNELKKLIDQKQQAIIKSNFTNTLNSLPTSIVQGSTDGTYYTQSNGNIIKTTLTTTNEVQTKQEITYSLDPATNMIKEGEVAKTFEESKTILNAIHSQNTK